MNALKADPRTIDLRALAPHFYRLGVRILQLFEEEEMVDILNDVCFVCFLYGLCTFFFSYIALHYFFFPTACSG